MFLAYLLHYTYLHILQGTIGQRYLSTVSKLYPMSADICNLDNQVPNYTYIFSVCIKTTSKKGVFNFHIAIGTVLIWKLPTHVCQHHQHEQHH